ncbi:hypothetical protein [Tabrizicola sp. M-4]|uniref:hypothetical protein n=1 Tax=Tabrizicola sp. M-4 TaxID=3055847 RepID=UPI003DAA250F
MKKLLAYFFSLAGGAVVALMVTGLVPCTSLYFLTSGGQRIPFPNDQEAMKELLLSGSDVVQTCRAFGFDLELTAVQFSFINIAILVSGMILGLIVCRNTMRSKDSGARKRSRADW